MKNEKKKRPPTYLGEERVHPFGEGLLLNAEPLLLQHLDAALLEFQHVLSLRHYWFYLFSIVSFRFVPALGGGGGGGARRRRRRRRRRRTVGAADGPLCADNDRLASRRLARLRSAQLHIWAPPGRTNPTSQTEYISRIIQWPLSFRFFTFFFCFFFFFVTQPPPPHTHPHTGR